MSELENPSFTTVAAFCRTFEAGSFTAAARALGVAPQSTARAVARLEKHLGVALFRRTTRTLQPTDEARAYYRTCSHAIELLRGSAQSLASARAITRGRVRICVPTSYAHHALLPALAPFHRRYPQVTLELQLCNRTSEFVANGYDLAIGFAPVADSSLTSRKLGDFSLGVFASPDYLATAGTPKHPHQLSSHGCIGSLLAPNGRVLPWLFASAPLQYEPICKYLVSDDYLGTFTLAIAGLGLAQLPHYVAADAVAQGDLMEVLTPFAGRSRKMVLLVPRDTRPSRAVKAMIDFIIESAIKQKSKRPRKTR